MIRRTLAVVLTMALLQSPVFAGEQLLALASPSEPTSAVPSLEFQSLEASFLANPPRFFRTVRKGGGALLIVVPITPSRFPCRID